MRLVEVHFVLDIDRPWLAEDQPLIEEGYKDYWQQVLPGRVQGQQILVNLGPQIEGANMGTPPKPMSPMIYNAVSRDGSREWELGFQGNQVVREVLALGTGVESSKQSFPYGGEEFQQKKYWDIGC